MNSIFRKAARIEFIKNVIHRSRNNSRMRVIFPRKLVARTFFAFHRVRFASSSLAIRKNRAWITAKNFFDDRNDDFFVDADLRWVRTKNWKKRGWNQGRKEMSYLCRKCSFFYWSELRRFSPKCRRIFALFQRFLFCSLVCIARRPKNWLFFGMS